MKYRNLGSTNIKVSPLAVGCMSFGKHTENNQWSLNYEDTEKTVQRAIEMGLNFFDTANVYAAGTSEEYLGRALKENHIPRDQVVIASKVYFNSGRLSSEAIHRELDQSFNVSLMPYSSLAGGHLAHTGWKTNTLRSKTDPVLRGKYDDMEKQDLPIIERVYELAQKHQVEMSEIALAWEWAKGVTAPIIGAIDHNPPTGTVLLDKK